MKPEKQTMPSLETHTHRSFILRFWINAEGDTRIRLINAQTGQQYLLDTMEELFGLLTKLTKEQGSPGSS